MTENTSPNLPHQFQKGQSGNPAGKPRGARHKATIFAERLMQDDIERIVGAVLTAAGNGDMTAAKIEDSNCLADGKKLSAVRHA